MKTNAEYFCEGYEKGVADEQIKTNEARTVLTTLVERLTNNWELLCSGTQNGLKTALLSEANELLNKINK